MVVIVVAAVVGGGGGLAVCDEDHGDSGEFREDGYDECYSTPP